MKKKKYKQWVSRLLVSVLCLTMVTGNIYAMENNDDVKNGFFDTSGEWKEGTLTQTLPEGIHSVNKEAVKVSDNTYDITLEVVTEETTEQLSKKCATVLVIDTSKSMDEDRRLVNAKKAAKDFIRNYSGEKENTGRYLSIVEFSGGVSTVHSWTDVSNPSGKEQCNKAVDSMRAYGGTNLHAGLKQADSLLNNPAVQNIEYKNTVVLTDGAPTFYLKKCRLGFLCLLDHVKIDNVKYHIKGFGDDGSEKINAVTAEEAGEVRKKSDVYTVCYGAENMETYGGGPLVSDYLRNKIASQSGNAYNAENVEELNKAFEDITETIVNGIDGKGLPVVTGSAPFVSVSGVSSEAGEVSPEFVWTLKDAKVSSDGNKTYYTYKFSYQVVLDADNPEFEEDKWYPLSGPTYLTLEDGTKVNLPVPAGKGKKTRFTVTYNDGVENEEIFQDVVYSDLVYGSVTPEFEGIPEREGYTFKGWTPEVAPDVLNSALYKAMWVKNAEIINEAPVIHATDLELYVGDRFEPLEGVTATDKEDGDLTNAVEVEKNTVNTEAAGTYEVIYSVMDETGIKVKKTISVVVKPVPVELNEAPVIHATDLELYVGDRFEPLEGVTATDKEDGDLTNAVEVEKNTVNTETAGTYEVTYSVMDETGIKVKKTISVVVKPVPAELNEAPVIHATDLELYVGDRFEPLEGVTATDKEDGDLTNAVEVEKNSVDTTKAGSYEVTYSVVDKNGEKTEKTILVVVKNTNPESESQPEKNDNNTKPASPETGDSAPLELLLILTAMMITGLFTLKLKKK